MEKQIINSKSNVLTTVDFVKFICAIMVVGIHSQPFGDRLMGVFFDNSF